MLADLWPTFARRALAFDHLGASDAASEAFGDDPASQGVSARRPRAAYSP